MTPEQWIINGETGVSSMTIWAVLMNAVMDDEDRYRGSYDIPYDSGDFGRCYKLLEAVPGFRERLGEVGERFPIWRPFVREWEFLERMYAQEHYEELSRRIRTLVDEGRIEAGWKKQGKSSWKKPSGGTAGRVGNVEFETP